MHAYVPQQWPQVATSGRIRPEVLVCPAECGWLVFPSGNWKDSGNSVKWSHTPCTPSNGGCGFNRFAHSAEPTPRVCGLVHWFIGIFVIADCAAIQAANKFATWLFGGIIGVGPVEGSLGAKFAVRWVWEGQVELEAPQDEPKRVPGIILGTRIVACQPLLAPF